jgi:hypothetical protein
LLFSRTSSTVRHKNPATTASGIPCSRESIRKNRSAFDHGLAYACMVGPLGLPQTYHFMAWQP